MEKVFSSQNVQFERVLIDLDPSYKKSTTKPPSAKISAIEIFLDLVEEDLFNKTVNRYVSGNWLDERKAFKKFCSTSGDKRASVYFAYKIKLTTLFLWIKI